MAYIISRNSVLGVKAETTEGALIDPASDADYVKLQDDVSIAENRETLDNAELTGSIGVAKPITGLSAPTLSFSSYLKHSGVEGQAPNAGKIFKSLFGSESVAATEYDTVAASTSTVVKVDAGEGVNFARGQALLVKDPTNGYSIRPIESVATDDLTLGFALPGAPASGVDLGKAVTYSPADTGHDTLSMHLYMGNGGLHQAIVGTRVTGYDITADAGQLINGSFSFEGTALYNNPITITTANNKLDFSETGPVVGVATIPAAVYADPEALATAIQTALQAAATVDTLTCSYNNSTGKFTLASDGTTFSLLWNTGANTANTIGTTIGFAVAADDTGALTYTSDSALSWVAPHTPDFDETAPIAAKNQEVYLSTDSSYACVNPSTVGISIANTKANINSICSASGIAASLITGRDNTITYTAILAQHDVSKFASFRRGDTVRFLYNFGTKADGVNWDAGKCGCIYAPDATISNLEVVDEDGIARVSVEIKPYVKDSLGEIYLSFV